MNNPVQSVVRDGASDSRDREGDWLTSPLSDQHYMHRMM